MSDRDERLAFIRQWAQPYAHNMSGLTGDINFLLSELDTATRCYQRWEELYHQRRANEIAADERAARAEARVQRLTDTLRSIARNSCCDRCQEAALVARAALAEGETV